MWFWRKKSQGFDWHTYVPTRILVRREKRKAKLEQIKADAVDGAVAVGKAAVAGAQAGARDVGRGVGEVVNVARKGGAKLAAPLAKQVGPLGDKVGQAGSTIYEFLARPGFAMPFVLCGAIALTSGIYRYVALPAERVVALVPIIVGLVLFVLAVPSVRRQFGYQTALVPARVRRIAERAAVPLIAVVLVAGGYFWLIRGKEPSGMIGATQWLSSLGLSSVTGGLASAKAIEGRSAGVVAGDAIRLQGSVFRISGIESPDKQQMCGKTGQSKRWKCGEAAVSALEKMIKGKAVRCVPYGNADPAGLVEARCEAEGQDVAAELVRQGYVFSSSLYFGGYAALESEARGQSRGIWGGEIERPADYRARIWEMAKLSAPDGCPIKGQVTSSGKTYVLPWSVDYSRTTIKSQRGERWFCSEDEAVAAGWKAAKRG
jgi:endonuclease YncB( thermonuclease family)